MRHLRHCEECAEEVNLLQQADSMPLLGAAYLPPAEEEDPGRKAPVPSLSVAAANARAARLAAEKAAAEGKRRPPMDPPARPVLRTIEGGAGAPEKRRWWHGLRLLRTPMPRSIMISFLALGVLAVATVALTSRIADVHYYRIQAGWSNRGAAVKLVGNQLELLVEHMPSPAAGSGYQVWVRDRGSKRFKPTPAWIHLNQLGQAGVNVPGDYHDVAVVAVYLEPLVGDRTVQRAAFVVGDLSSLS